MSSRDREGAPHPVDVHVGGRVRAARQAAGLSLATLAGRVGVAFQQLQKYEAGANRISASMLHALAQALKTPVTSFFEGLDATPIPCGLTPELTARIRGVLAAPGGAAALDLFLGLPPAARRHLAALAAALRAPGGASAADGAGALQRDPGGAGG